VDGISRDVALQKVKDNYPDCYSADLSFLDRNLALGTHTLTVTALGIGDGGYGDKLYEFSESVDIELTASSGDENHINVGDTCEPGFATYIVRRDSISGAYNPIDLTFSFGYCPWRVNVDMYCHYQVSAQLCRILPTGEFQYLTGAGVTTLQGTDLRIYHTEATGWKIRAEYAYMKVDILGSCETEVPDLQLMTDGVYSYWNSQAYGIILDFDYKCGEGMVRTKCPPPEYPY